MHYKNKITSFSKIKTLTTVLCLFFIVAIGLTVRLEDVRDWQQQPEISFFNGEPLLTTIDGYYYLRLARDLAQGNYALIDSLRTWPEQQSRPFPPPLLSVLAAGISKAGNFSINWVGVLLPAFLGIMVIAPVFAIGRLYGGTSMGLTSALMLVLSYGYLTRSALGWFDTDCLNIFFTMSAIYCCFRFSQLKTRKRYLYFIAFMLDYGLFLWWWDSTPQAVTAIVFLPLFVSLFLFYRPPKDERFLFLGCLILLFLGVLIWLGFDLPIKIAKNLAGTLHYISKQNNDFFPNVNQLVLEQHPMPLRTFIDQTVKSNIAFLMALGGLITLAIKQPKKILFLLAPCILTITTLIYSQRFIIFAVPIISLGLGYCISLVWQLKTKHPKAIALTPLLVLIIAGINLQADMAKTFWQFNPSGVTRGMAFIAQRLPANAIVFGRWDIGYPLQYWAERPTVADGACHGGELSVYNAIPPAAQSDRLAANFINFFVQHGKQGFTTVYQAVNNDKDRGLKLLKKIFTAGPDKSYNIIEKEKLHNHFDHKTTQAWIHFFFPKSKRPIYWFLDYDMTNTTYWWFWLGTWKIRQGNGVHPRFRPFLHVRNDSNLVSNGNDVYGNLTDGVITTSTRKVDIQQAEIIFGYDKSHKIEYPVTPKNKDNYFSLFKPGQLGALQGRAIHDSVFSRLFIRQEKSPYFIPVRLHTPAYQIYLIRPDTIPETGRNRQMIKEGAGQREPL